MGAISQIFGILNEISFGYNFISLRESVLLSKILLSAESWHKLFQYQIEKLEEVDKIFYRKLFNSHAKTGEEFFFIETGTISIKLKLSMRRLIYWWNILHVNK